MQTRFKALRGSPKEKAQRGQYLLAVDLGRYIVSFDMDNVVRGLYVACSNLNKQFVRSHTGWRGEPNILYKGVKTSP